MRSEGLFTPGSQEGTLMLPGFLGGGNWSGAAVDPTTGVLYVSANNFPSILTLKEAPDSLLSGPAAPAFTAQGYAHFVDEEGYPAIKPPWGTLTAIDLNEGETIWQVPLGTYPELVERGHPPTGTLNLGGAIVTAGGLVFIASTMDRKFRAFDKATGEVLWEAELPTGGMALPATYEVDGKQYVVIAAGGGTGMRGERPNETPPGSSYVVFALP
jgi:quinoprotein glucose dehydrogenase